MIKQEIIKQIYDYSSFIKKILDEYRSEFIYENENRVIDLLSDVTNCLSDGLIPESLYFMISKLIQSLEIEKLVKLYEDHKGLHSWMIYKTTCDTIIVNSFFVSRTFHLLKAIGFTNSNVVLIGANGCGKTTFANSIREELEKTNNGIVIPAQKLLIFPTYSSIPLSKTAHEDFEKRQKTYLDDKQTYTAAKNDDYPYLLAKEYSEELRILVSALIAERIERRNSYCSNIKDGDIVAVNDFKSTIDDVIDIWNFLIEHRTLDCDNTYTLSIKYKDKTYPAFRMSDGEREIFYVVGRILLAKESSLIIIDEPELHLHKAILNKLWDILETKRKDCMFIYLTHDVDFAATRIAKKCWLKSYSGDLYEFWDVEPIENSEIPEALLYKLLGSRKQILFCEGKQGSLDRQIFEILFPKYTVISLSSCKDVITYTRAFNKIKNIYAKAAGIIDRDFRTEEQLSKLESDYIYSYNVAEIENLFIVDEFIEGFAKYKHESINLDTIKEKVIDLLLKNKEEQAAWFVSQKINYTFKEGLHLKNGKNKIQVAKLFKDFIAQINTDDWYEDRITEIENIIENSDYNKCIRLYNNKGLHSIVEQALKISSYNEKALDYLKVEDNPKQILRSYFPLFLFND